MPLAIKTVLVSSTSNPNKIVTTVLNTSILPQPLTLKNRSMFLINKGNTLRLVKNQNKQLAKHFN
jgi:hypothetical protein